MSIPVAHSAVEHTAVPLPAEQAAPSAILTPRPLSLRKNFAWTLAGNVVYAGCQWGMLIVLAKLGSPEMVGQFALGLAVTGPVFMFANLQLRAVQATDARREYEFRDYIGLRLLTTALAFLVIAGIAGFCGYRRETALVILAIGTAKAVESVSDVIYGRLQQQQRMDRIARVQMVKGFISLVSWAAALYFTYSVACSAAALAVTWATCLIVCDFPNGAWVQGGRGESYRPSWNGASVWRLAWLALPLGVSMLLISLSTNIPRYFIEYHLGERELGIFAALAYLMVAGHTVVVALGQSASPRLATLYVNQDLTAFRYLLLRLMGIAVLLGALGIFLSYAAGRQILTLLYTAEYAAHSNVLIWLMGAAAVIYIASFLGYSVTATRCFRVQVPLFVLVATSSAFLCRYMVPAHRLHGAAWAVLLAAVVQVIGSAGINAYALRHAHNKGIA